MSDQSREKATIFVGGLDSQVTAETLYDAFIPFGEISDVTLPKPEL
jgi:RNA recognition motif-containing protein